MPDQPLAAPDGTAVRVALWRAMHVQVDPPPHVLEDEVGLRLADPADGWRRRPDLDPHTTSRARASIVARARFVEDLVAEQAALGVGQYVILGAGLDTFAQRRPEIAAGLRAGAAAGPARPGRLGAGPRPAAGRPLRPAPVAGRHLPPAHRRRCARRVGDTMSTASLVAHQARYDLRVYLRDPRARGFTLALPLLLLLLFGYIFRHETFSNPGSAPIPGDVYYLPRMIVLGMTSATLSNLVVVLVAKRETGALKRRRATPVQPVVLIGGDVITTELSVLTIVVLLTAIGWAVFGVHLTAAGGGAVLVTSVVGTAALCGVAYAVATVIKSIDAAGPLVMLVMFGLNAISGIYVPESLFPGWLREVALVLPVRPLAVAMQAAFDPRTNGGRQLAWPDLLIVAAWGVAGTLYAALRFSWSPSRA
jgi:ABC-2 type transport system permease protein